MIKRVLSYRIGILALLVTVQACGSAGTDPLGQIPPERSGSPPGAWLLSRPDGSVQLRASGLGHGVLSSWEHREPEDPVNPGAPLGAPTIAYDPVDERVWYSDAHASIRSVDARTGTAGPTFSSFADTAIQGCGVTSSGRLFAIDPVRRLLYAPMLTGQVLAYDLRTQDVRASVPMSAFNDLILGSYRTLAIDPGGMMWALDGSGNAHEYDPDHARATGRMVPASADDLVIDTGRGLLLLREGDTLRAVSLDGLEDLVMDPPPPPLTDVAFAVPAVRPAGLALR